MKSSSISDNALIKYQKIALEVAQKSGDYLLSNFGSVKMVENEEELHFHIQDDVNTNDIYENYLHKHTPEVGIFSEEGERDLTKELTWIIDPIEGTSNYRVGIPFFATQISLVYGKEPIISCLIAPALNQVFLAVKGKGTYLNNKKVFVGNTNSMKDSLICIGKGTNIVYNRWYAKSVSGLLPFVRTIRSFGSCGLELAYLSSGKIDLVIYNGAKAYDYITGVLFVREAEGVAVNGNGEDWSFSDRLLLSTNRNIYKEIFDSKKNITYF